MKPVVLAILDGVGLRNEVHGNAFAQAKKPNLDFLMSEYPHSELEASGVKVGLPEDQMGNSEVGHLNIGAGRIVYQPLELINNAIRTGGFYSNGILINAINCVKRRNSKLHIFGLVSDGGVHSHINHIIALLKLAKDQEVEKVYLHCFTDGRDTLPDIALTFLKQLEKATKDIGIGKIATVSGRYYAMDRDKRWDRTKLAYDAIVNGVGPYNDDIESIIEASFKKEIYDEFIVPTVVDKDGMVEENDVIIVANFRPDRLIQICSALTGNDFNDFEIKKFPNLKLITMFPVAGVDEEIPAFRFDKLENTLGEYLSKNSLKQLRIAETEKYAHVTYFFDGGAENEWPGCKKVLIHSPRVATYDLKPEMSANEITESLLKELDNDYDVVILNFANGDMVGHTGNLEAAIQAVETVDMNIGLIYEKVKEKGGLLIITADHGNCEYMLDDENNVITTHTTNKVPFIVCDKEAKVKDGKLADIAPTIIRYMDKVVPCEMNGVDLVDRPPIVSPEEQTKKAV